MVPIWELWFWKDSMKAHKQMDKEQDKTDPCLQHNCSYDVLIVCSSWINENLLLGKKKGVEFQ